DIRRRYRRASAGLVAFFVLLLAALAAAAASTVPAQLREGRLTSALLRADWLSSRGEGAAAVAEGLRALDVAAREGTPLRTAALGGREEDDAGRILRLHEWTSRLRVGEPRWSAALHRAWLARLLLARNEPRFSLAVSEEVLLLAPNHPAPLEDTGLALLLLGRPRGARLAFEDALALCGADDVRRDRLPRYIGVARAFEEAAAAGGDDAYRRALDLAREAGLPLSGRPPGNR
ncbi:MAG: hypothetical protein MUE73_05480, partial [Planctomycetes bacterium]|nr:hypothetical protein [Planctomycetota bacterium]